jgi:putative addiction module killer protein
LRVGLFGDAKLLREGHGVRELRVDCGRGYRVYYALAGRTVVLLLCGGVKRNQRADIANAVGYWLEFKGRER